MTTEEYDRKMSRTVEQEPRTSKPLPDVDSRWRAAGGGIFVLTQLARDMEHSGAPWRVVLCEDDADGRAWVCTLELLHRYFVLVEEERGNV